MGITIQLGGIHNFNLVSLEHISQAYFLGRDEKARTNVSDVSRHVQRS